LIESFEVMKIFKDKGALLNGHFRLSSGLHSDQYLQCALLLQFPDLAERLCTELAFKIRELHPSVIISPAIGGILVGQEVARALKIRAIFTERNRETDKMELRRGFSVQSNDRVVAVEDVITTGVSIYESTQVIEQFGASVVGVGCLVQRNQQAVKYFNSPIYSLLQIAVQSWTMEECPACQKNIPIIKPGSRAK
jgi:orotate phosphoribosyltransferase